MYQIIYTMKNRIFNTVLLLCCLLVAAPVSAKKWRAKHVVLIALDGWGAYSVPKGDIPHIKSVMEQGSYTLHKRSVFPSASAINWASMFMGVGTELHGYTKWGSKTPEIPSRVVNEHNISPTIFSILREQCPEAEIGVLHEWEGIKYLVDTLALSHRGQAPSYDDYPEALCEMAETYIKEKKPALTAVCFDQLDHAGHKAGHDTEGYYACLHTMDSYVGRILQAVKDAGMWEDTVIMITADHGGIDKGHGGITMEEVEIPFIIAGKGIKQSGEFQESMMQFDTASTIAYVFRLEQPQVWIGRPMKQVFKK